METLSIQLPDGLVARIAEAAERGQTDRDVIVRLALEAYLATATAPSVSAKPASFLELAGDLIGCLEGPGDLSYNPKYMEGFGE